MPTDPSDAAEIPVIRGEFFTDGTTFVFRLDGTPLSGTGDSPEAAFADLMRADTAAGGLARRLRELARDQQGEAVRASVIRMVMIALIVFGVVGGALVGTAAMLPRVVADVVETTVPRLSAAIEAMPPETEEKFARLMQRVGTMLYPAGASCTPANPAGTGASPGNAQ